MEKRRLETIERCIFEFFRDRGTAQVLTKDIFQSTQRFANADMVRALEDLEKKWRLLVRHTSEGNDWVTLTPEGAAYAQVNQVGAVDQPTGLPHPPKSAT
jgi:hypothetical protein